LTAIEPCLPSESLNGIGFTSASSPLDQLVEAVGLKAA
jgi:hypothetical protein